MKTRRYAITLTGETPLITHCDNVAWKDYMKKWLMDPANRKSSVPGDGRTPAFAWLGALYIDDDKVVIPSDNIMKMVGEGGSKLSTGKGNATFKRIMQGGGVVVDQLSWPLLVNGKEIPYAPLKALSEELDFAKHCEVAASLGFELFVKRVPVGNSGKQIRVRPKFYNWSCSGTMTVMDSMVTTAILKDIFTFAGSYSGLGDWRPSAPKSPGPYGRFAAALKQV